PKHTAFDLRRWNYGDAVDTYGVSINVNGRHEMYAGWNDFFASAPGKAPLIHFCGPLELRMLRSDEFVVGGVESRLSIAFINKGLGNGAHSRLSIDAVDKSVIPVVNIEWPVAKGTEPLRTTHRLPERCCYWEFYTTEFAVPARAVQGTATVTVSLPVGALPFELAKDRAEMPVRSKTAKATTAISRPHTQPIEAELPYSEFMKRLRQPIQAIAGETELQGQLRIHRATLSNADAILKQPGPTRADREFVIEKKAFALRQLNDLLPEYRDDWVEFATVMMQEWKGTQLEPLIAYLALESRVLGSPKRSENIAEIEAYASRYPNGPPAIDIYFGLSNRLEMRRGDLAARMLSDAARIAPPERAAALRKHRQWVKLSASKPDLRGRRLNGSVFDDRVVEGKCVLVYSWAMTCAPCIAKFPLLRQLHFQFHNRGFEILMLNTDDDKEAARQFMKKQGNPWIDLAGIDSLDPIRAKMGTPGMLLIGRDGTVLLKTVIADAELAKVIESLVD
ncbi:MAG: TlpA family protein disulfide reductase, partial [Planctomycetaceae bacterium]